MSRRDSFTIGAVFVLLSLIWGTTWAAIRIGLEGIPPFTGVALRFAIASAMLLAVAPFMGVRFGRLRAERRLWIANAALSFCGSYGIVYWAEQYVPSGLAATLFATFPLFVALIAHAALPAERLSVRAAIGVLVGFGGVALIFSEDFARLGGRGVALAAIVMLGSPIVSAVANVAIKKWGSGIHPVSLAAVPMAIAAVVMGGVAAAVEREKPIVFSTSSVVALLYLGVFGSAITFTLYYWLMNRIAASRASLIAYVTPVVAVAIGAVFLDEPVTPKTIGGALLVIGGVALAVAKRGEASRRDATSEGGRDH